MNTKNPKNKIKNCLFNYMFNKLPVLPTTCSPNYQLPNYLSTCLPTYYNAICKIL